MLARAERIPDRPGIEEGSRSVVGLREYVLFKVVASSVSISRHQRELTGHRQPANSGDNTARES